jgi:hypothetical protein
MPESALVSEAETQEEKENLWGRSDGPWREVFIRFFALVRDYFGDSEDMEAYNAWGSTKSNLYNKVSLTILAADFFEYLCSQQRTLHAVEDVDKAVAEWLQTVKTSYFSRAVREKWAKIWHEYRKNPLANLPTPAAFRVI